jgi:type I restriction enzyme R subunit
VNLEKLYLFNKFLQKKLPTINNPLPYTVLEDVDIDSYKIVNKGLKEITLISDGEIRPITASVGEYAPEINQKLSNIIKALNDAFGTDFTDDDKIFLGRVKDNLLGNKDLLNKIENNSKDNVKAIFDKYFNDEMSKLLNSNMKFYKRIVDNEKLKTKLKSALFDLVYYEYSKKKKEDKKEVVVSKET